MYTITQTADYVEFYKSMSSFARVMFALAALVPLITPYEFLIKPSWQGMSTGMILALLISLGAIVLSIVLVMVSLTGLTQFIKVDFSTKTVTYGRKSLIKRYHETNYRFSQIAELKIVAHDWTDGPSSYDLIFITTDGTKIEFGDFNKRVMAEQYRDTLSERIFNTSKYSPYSIGK